MKCNPALAPARHRGELQISVGPLRITRRASWIPKEGHIRDRTALRLWFSFHYRIGSHESAPRRIARTIHPERDGGRAFPFVPRETVLMVGIASARDRHTRDVRQSKCKEVARVAKARDRGQGLSSCTVCPAPRSCAVSLSLSGCAQSVRARCMSHRGRERGRRSCIAARYKIIKPVVTISYQRRQHLLYTHFRLCALGPARARGPACGMYRTPNPYRSTPKTEKIPRILLSHKGLSF